MIEEMIEETIEDSMLGLKASNQEIIVSYSSEIRAEEGSHWHNYFCWIKIDEPES